MSKIRYAFASDNVESVTTSYDPQTKVTLPFFAPAGKRFCVFAAADMRIGNGPSNDGGLVFFHIDGVERSRAVDTVRPDALYKAAWVYGFTGAGSTVTFSIKYRTLTGNISIGISNARILVFEVDPTYSLYTPLYASTSSLAYVSAGSVVVNPILYKDYLIIATAGLVAWDSGSYSIGVRLHDGNNTWHEYAEPYGAAIKNLTFRKSWAAVIRRRITSPVTIYCDVRRIGGTSGSFDSYPGGLMVIPLEYYEKVDYREYLAPLEVYTSDTYSTVLSLPSSESGRFGVLLTNATVRPLSPGHAFARTVVAGSNASDHTLYARQGPYAWSSHVELWAGVPSPASTHKIELRADTANVLCTNATLTWIELGPPFGTLVADTGVLSCRGSPARFRLPARLSGTQRQRRRRKRLS